VADLETAVNKYAAPHIESVATTGIGVEETLKGITKLVLNNLVQKYGLEGTESIEDLQILDAPAETLRGESVWEDADDDPLNMATSALGAVAMNVVVDDVVDAQAPMAATELIRASRAPATLHTPPPDPQLFFEDEAPLGDPWQEDDEAMEVPLASIEMPMPRGLLESLPDLVSPAFEPERDPLDLEAAAHSETFEPLVREVTVPLQLTRQELQNHRTLRLRINLDIDIED
jgi:hypothetical protein